MTQSLEFQFQMSGPDGEKTVVAGRGSTTLGRQSDNDWSLPHGLVSRYHARLDCEGESCAITDLDSSNGTLLNGEPLPPNQSHRLQAGDVVAIGPYRLEYEPQTVVAPEPEEVLEQEPLPQPEEEPFEEEPAPPEEDAQPAQQEAKEPPPPSQTPPPGSNGHSAGSELPPGLYLDTSRYLQYLPDIYHTDFMGRFLAVFESILGPIEWTVDNFDLFLSPDTAPDGFLPWLSSWFDLTLDASWTNEQRRALLAEAGDLFARRGTRRALGRVLEIYLQQPVVIDDEGESLEPFTFAIYLPLPRGEVRRDLVERLVDAHKPAHTTYELHFLDEKGR